MFVTRHVFRAEGRLPEPFWTKVGHALDVASPWESLLGYGEGERRYSRYKPMTVNVVHLLSWLIFSAVVMSLFLDKERHQVGPKPNKLYRIPDGTELSTCRSWLQHGCISVQMFRLLSLSLFSLCHICKRGSSALLVSSSNSCWIRYREIAPGSPG